MTSTRVHCAFFLAAFATAGCSDGAGDSGGSSSSTSQGGASSSSGSASGGAGAADGAGGAGGTAAHPWEEGSFRSLPAITAALVDWVDALEHPENGEYRYFTEDRVAAFDVFFDALLEATETVALDPNGVAWCAIQDLAAEAGYALRRFHDEESGRWFLYGFDSTGFGHAHVLINPSAKRNVVIEVPHAGYEALVDVQGARLLLDYAARALLLNGEHRCSDPDPADCDEGTNSACDYYRESDVAHHPLNAFQRMHARLSDDASSPRFFQIHGMEGSAEQRAIVGDGSASNDSDGAISTAFTSALAEHVPGGAWSCQATADLPLCGSTNLQGRYTNGSAVDPCNDGTLAASGRFIHLEQEGSLRDDDESDGYSRADVLAALVDTWPDCDLGATPDDCALGPPQPDSPDLSCTR